MVERFMSGWANLLMLNVCCSGVASYESYIQLIQFGTFLFFIHWGFNFFISLLLALLLQRSPA
jgi:hypothetical protein